MSKKIAPPSLRLFVMTLIMALGDVLAVAAGTETKERISLMLSGQDCPAYRQAITEKLGGVPGVKRIDMDLIDGHLLIDRIQDQRTAGDFQTIVNDVIPPDGQCRAEIMESCISAGTVLPFSRQ